MEKISLIIFLVTYAGVAIDFKEYARAGMPITVFSLLTIAVCLA